MIGPGESGSEYIACSQSSLSKFKLCSCKNSGFPRYQPSCSVKNMIEVYLCCADPFGVDTGCHGFKINSLNMTPKSNTILRLMQFSCIHLVIPVLLVKGISYLRGRCSVKNVVEVY